MPSVIFDFLASWIAPPAAFASTFMVMFPYISPVLVLQTQVSLLVVKSSHENATDLPSLFFGPLGFCSRPDSTTAVNCTSPSLMPHYGSSMTAIPQCTRVDLDSAPRLYVESLLQDDALWLSAPVFGTPISIAGALGLSLVFSLLFTVITVRDKCCLRCPAMFSGPVIQHLALIAGVLNLVIGLPSFLALYLWFRKTVHDFNEGVQKHEDDDLKGMAAKIGNGFTLVWISYIIYMLPLFCLLAKVHYARPKSRTRGRESPTH